VLFIKKCVLYEYSNNGKKIRVGNRGSPGIKGSVGLINSTYYYHTSTSKYFGSSRIGSGWKKGILLGIAELVLVCVQVK
jgi:hypothetical protein